MSYLPTTKWGDCTQCPNKDCACVKVGKVLICVQCHRANKNQQQITKANDRNKQRYEASKNQNHKPTQSLKSSIRGLVDKGQAKVLDSLDRWFKDRRRELTGKCKHCGNPSCKNDDKYFKFSICHILPKAYFPSVATHPSNFVELCFWKNNCHGNMDSKMLDLTEMNCWDEIVTKFCVMYPFIAKEERRRIPVMLLQYIEVEK